MNQDQLARLERHRRVQQVLVTHAAAVASVPAFAQMAEQYQHKLALLDQELPPTSSASAKPASSLRKANGATVKAGLHALNLALKSSLRPGMRLLSAAHPAVYEALRSASQVQEPGQQSTRTQPKRPLPATTAALQTGASSGSPNQSVPLAPGAGDVYIIFSLDTLGDWDCAMSPPLVPTQHYSMGATRVARVDSYEQLLNRSKTWIITIYNTQPTKDLPYKGSVVITQAGSADQAAGSPPLYTWPLDATIKASDLPTVAPQGIISFY